MSSLEARASAREANGASKFTADAMFELGLRYCLGREVPKDLISAHKWFNIAAARGNDAAGLYRREVAREMQSSDIAEAQRQARAWLETN